jgi:hypothetical protein
MSFCRLNKQHFSTRMATTPCTLVIFTEDKVHFPVKTTLTVMRHLFQ